MTRPSNESIALAAMQRLLAGKPKVAQDTRLIDSNLIAESGIARATFYRLSPVLDAWRREKEKSVQSAIAQLREQCSVDTDLKLTDRDLLEMAGVDQAALNRMEDRMIAEWHTLRDRHGAIAKPKSQSRAATDTIKKLISIIMGLDLAIQQRDKVINEYRAKMRARSSRWSR